MILDLIYATYLRHIALKLHMNFMVVCFCH